MTAPARAPFFFVGLLKITTHRIGPDRVRLKSGESSRRNESIHAETCRHDAPQHPDSIRSGTAPTKTEREKTHSRSPTQRMPIHEVSTLKHAEKPSASAPKLWQ
ncbi:hypothetical protein LC55x_3391 [Lysobacter capsici]|uniref:hypothetical protein n=1 Tax=Lysobacter capsici TaxID=435897 RepID=UPI00071F7FE5|nr:hypothetical protein [Lysobacter capsici]ALN86650.1 hypothetical protein LC55x_3391 [Lysobacter capsici]